MPESAEETPQSESKTTDAPATTAKSGRGSLDDLPQEFSWVVDELSRVRSEAADRRTKLREAEAQITDLTEFRTKAEQAADAAKETELSLHRERALRQHGLADDDLEFLNELTDPEQIESRAARLAAKTAKKPERAVDPAQGTSSHKPKGTTADSFAEFFREALPER